MNTSQLQCVISCDPVLRNNVLGVFAADQLPNKLPSYPCGFLANTDLSSQPGTHWLAFFVYNDTVECFDSFGQSPGAYNPLFSRWIEHHARHLRVNYTRVQSDYSDVCGLYCVFFLRQRILGYSTTHILHHFSTGQLETNDKHILKLFKRVYAHCVKNKCVYNQTCKSQLSTV